MTDLHGQARRVLYVPLAQAWQSRDPFIIVRPSRNTKNVSELVRSALFAVTNEPDYVDVSRLHDFIAPQRTRPWELGTLLFGLSGLLWR